LKKDYRTAADEYKKALDGGDDTEDCCDGLATTLDFLGDYAGSARYAEQAIAIDNADLDAWGPASDAYIHLHRYADALRACKMMLIIDPNNMLAHENMAETYLAEGKVDDAKPEWRIVAAQGEPFLQSVAQKYLAKYP
jgi:tetratricopeptide (TPR) repeat protein